MHHDGASHTKVRCVEVLEGKPTPVRKITSGKFPIHLLWAMFARKVATNGSDQVAVGVDSG